MICRYKIANICSILLVAECHFFESLEYISIVLFFPLLICDFNPLLHFMKCVPKHFSKVTTHVIYPLFQFLNLIILLLLNVLFLILQFFMFLYVVLNELIVESNFT